MSNLNCIKKSIFQFHRQTNVVPFMEYFSLELFQLVYLAKWFWAISSRPYVRHAPLDRITVTSVLTNWVYLESGLKRYYSFHMDNIDVWTIVFVHTIGIVWPLCCNTSIFTCLQISPIRLLCRSFDLQEIIGNWLLISRYQLKVDVIVLWVVYRINFIPAVNKSWMVDTT